MSQEQEAISILSWYCCNCGTKITSIRNEDGYYKAKCPKCGSCSVRKIMSRRRDVIEIIAPKGQVNTEAL